MDTTFEFFEGTATVNSTTPRVTVRKSGQLVLTEAAVALLGEGVDQVQIGYNDKARAVGIKAATEGGRGVLKLRTQPNGGRSWWMRNGSSPTGVWPSTRRGGCEAARRSGASSTVTTCQATCAAS